MRVAVRSVLESGFDGILVDIECHLSNGLPNIIIVGFASKAVDEAKERIRSAFASSKIDLPRKRITINLAPADVPKDSTSLDLAIASAILATSGAIKAPLKTTAVIGELSLDGSVRAVRGIIGKLLSAQKQGIANFVIPSANLEQAKLIPDINLLPVDSLKDYYLHQSGAKLITPIRNKNPEVTYSNKTHSRVDFQEVVGQRAAKRALEIAAAGGHNVLMSGPPGTGKSMLAKASISILPPLTSPEALEITHLHSLASLNFDQILTERPFRTPHHSASDTAVIGGGKNPRPGEISLSHRGILFFDELPEFSRVTLEALRQPLEDRVITVSRAKDTITFPANFMLVATANPCPCGYFGTHKECVCTPQQIARYQHKLSGPILDRIDIFTDVENVEHTRLLEEDSSTETSDKVANRVIEARRIQNKRFDSPTRTNSDMSSGDIKKLAKVAPEARQLLDKAAKRLELSPRSYMRTIKVARTIADLDRSPSIRVPHITEAIQYRPKKTVML